MPSPPLLWMVQSSTSSGNPRETAIPSAPKDASPVIDRGSIRTWEQLGSTDTFTRAKDQVKKLLDRYQPPDSPGGQVSELKQLVSNLAKNAGMDRLPKINH